MVTHREAKFAGRATLLLLLLVYLTGRNRSCRDAR